MTGPGPFWNAELETMPWPDVLAWQAKRVTERFGSGELPFTNKDELRRSQEHPAPGEPFGGHQTAPLERIIQVVSSSGTTGNPVYYGLTASDLDVWTDAIAGVFFTAGIRPDDVVAHLVGLPVVAGGLPYADAFRRIGATLAWLGGLPTERILRSLPRLQVSALLATTSFGTYLVDHCREMIGVEAASLGVRKLLGGGEPGLGQPEIRAKIRDGWGLEAVRETMGLGDVLASMWGECGDESGMHFCAQGYVAVELIDPVTGDAVAWQEGASGEPVYTTFAREATPVVRFRSSDQVEVTGVGCPCGRTSPKIRCVGRTDDMLIYKGMNVFPSAIRDVVLGCFSDAVEPYMRIWKERADQVRFDRPIPLEVEARPTLGAARYPDIGAGIEAELRTRLQVRVDVSVVAPGTLPRSAYKTPLVYVRPSE